MLGNLYDEALTGERCWIRYDDGSVQGLPVHSWLPGGRRIDRAFDQAVLGLCNGPTIDLGCGPGRFVAHLTKLGIPALGVDQSQTAVELARRSGAPALRRDVFERLPGTGRWGTVLLADGNVGLGGDPTRLLRRVGELMRSGGHCVAEFDPTDQRCRAPVGPARVVEDRRALVPMGLGRRRLRHPPRQGRRPRRGVSDPRRRTGAGLPVGRLAPACPATSSSGSGC